MAAPDEAPLTTEQQQQNLQRVLPMLNDMVVSPTLGTTSDTPIRGLLAAQQQDVTIRETTRELPPPPPGRGRRLKVDWAAAAAHIHKTYDRYPAVRLNPKISKDAWQRPLLPCLMPANASWAENAHLVYRDNYYIASASQDGITVEVYGTRVANELDDIPVATRLMSRLKEAGSGPLITRNEFGIDASIQRFGVNYEISLMCDNPEESRCTDDSYIRKLVDNLLIVGGSRPQGE